MSNFESRTAEVTLGVDETNGRILTMDIHFNEPMTRSELKQWLAKLAEGMKTQ